MVSRFVPKHDPVNQTLLRRLRDELSGLSNLVVLTGAGISTESGIPDYRSEKVGLYERSNHRPVTHQEFMKSETIRRRYWARNFLAWPNFSSAKCNATHSTLASWERSERFGWLITQNVDGLHDKCVFRRKKPVLLFSPNFMAVVTEFDVCLVETSLPELQRCFSELNPEWGGGCFPGEVAPDGDVQIEPGAEEGFSLPDCGKCGGSILKTDVVFFGDNVPRTTVDFLYSKVDSSDGLLVLGSSLSVMSGYRFAYHAHVQKKPVLIVNIGPTRADHLATLKLSARISDVITQL